MLKYVQYQLTHAIPDDILVFDEDYHRQMRNYKKYRETMIYQEFRLFPTPALDSLVDEVRRSFGCCPMPDQDEDIDSGYDAMMKWNADDADVMISVYMFGDFLPDNETVYEIRLISSDAAAVAGELEDDYNAEI